MSRSIAFRCDGGHEVGAGHVARCLPLAQAFVERGWAPVMVGRYDGLAGWMIDRAGLPVSPPGDGPAGLAPAGGWAAAIVDSYSIPEAEVCALAGSLAVATLGEATCCPDRGVVVDYHLDANAEASTPRRLAGGAFALVDPAFAAFRRDREPVCAALITVGGSSAAAALVPRLVEGVRRAFGDVRVLVSAAGAVPDEQDVERLPFPGTLLDAVGAVDIACSGAGVTAYELACAGVPSVVVALAGNQRRVLRGCVRAGTAIGVDAIGGLDPAGLDAALAELARPERRRALAAAGPLAIDGDGARRTAGALLERWFAA